MHVRCEGTKLSLFWTASKWVTQHGIYDEPQVQMRFRCHNFVVLHFTIVGRAIGEQRGYAAEITFELVARNKFMLCRPLLDGFRIYPLL
jgi:hypothetical protein